MSHDRILREVDRYYSGKLKAHGATARGVDWNSTESQRMRFDQLLKICDRRAPFTLNDYGCGYGALPITCTRIYVPAIVVLMSLRK